jgi:DNA ligase D-like protein (predicted ligase)
MHKRPGEKRENWLLIKSDDEFARGAKDPDILEEENLSATTGRSMDEIAGAKSAVWHSNRPVKENAARLARAKPAKKKAAAKPAKATTAKAKTARPKAKRARPSMTKAKASKRKAKKAKADPVAGARPAPLPGFIQPCLALLSATAPDSADWIHEIKFDGYRVQARIDSGRVQLLTRKALDWTEKFAPVAGALERLPVEQAILDGELVSEGDDGHASFSKLQQDLKDGQGKNFVYYVFDLLYRDGYDLTPAPFEARKHALAQLFNGSKIPQVRLSEHFTEPGSVLLKHACSIGLEGIISKRRDAPYRPGRGGDWIKAKCSDRQEFVVAGYAPSTVDSRAIGALILAFQSGWEAALCRPRRHRLHPQGGARAVEQAAAAAHRKITFRRKAGGRNARAQCPMGEAETRGRGRPAGLDARRARAASFLPGAARGQIRQRGRAGGQSHGDSQRSAKKGAGRKSSIAEAKGADAGHHPQPSRPRLLGRRGRDQAGPGGILRARLEMDGPACDRARAGACALSGRRSRRMLFPEARFRRHRPEAAASCRRTGRR